MEPRVCGNKKYKKIMAIADLNYCKIVRASCQQHKATRTQNKKQKTQNPIRSNQQKPNLRGRVNGHLTVRFAGHAQTRVRLTVKVLLNGPNVETQKY